jgi:hypothetical protein
MYNYIVIYILLMNLSLSSTLIQKWWRRNTSTTQLYKVKNYLKTHLSCEDLQELSNKCNSINNYCKGDGSGLLGGSLIDMFICNYFQNKLPEYSEFHNGECDMKICDVPLSQKKINGKSIIALDWSKNETDLHKDYFSSHIMIINLKTEKWWKTKPLKLASGFKNTNVCYNDVIPSGIYLIDRKYCKKCVVLAKNNKTNSLIENSFLYLMLKRSIAQNLFIEIPEPNTKIQFNILNAFS